jgi:hypothetical protein
VATSEVPEELEPLAELELLLLLEDDGFMSVVVLVNGQSGGY